MTVRIAQSLGIEKIKLSKDLGIYDNPDKLLSVSLGSVDTTLLRLTAAYSTFINKVNLLNQL